ncbi:hypothetical protein TNCV_4853371 [Trichonephila clavipes]|nr:hypothetical protein TNCV_4853371 [Trichonephila clavipes]
MHPDLDGETQTEQIPDFEIRILRGTPGVNHVHPLATSSLSQAKLNFNLVVKTSVRQPNSVINRFRRISLGWSACEVSGSPGHLTGRPFIAHHYLKRLASHLA